MTVFIPEEDKLSLSAGSYEELMSRLSEAHGDGRLLATFASHAVFLKESGECVRVDYETAENGEIKVINTSEVEVRSFTEDKIKDYVWQESKDLVKNFLSGDVNSAKERVRGLVGLVDPVETQEINSDLVLQDFSARLESTTPWRTVLERKPEVVTKFVELAEAEEVEDKFTKLYDGSMSEEDLSNYADLVTTDVAHVASRIEELSQRINSARDSLQECGEKLAEIGEAGLKVMIEAFVDDLVDDLSRVSSLYTVANEQLEGVALKGKLFDVASNALPQYERGVQFAEAIVNKLRE